MPQSSGKNVARGHMLVQALLKPLSLRVLIGFMFVNADAPAKTLWLATVTFWQLCLVLWYFERGGIPGAVIHKLFTSMANSLLTLDWLL